jgi:hypothetical protein
MRSGPNIRAGMDRNNVHGPGWIAIMSKELLFQIVPMLVDDELLSTSIGISRRAETPSTARCGGQFAPRFIQVKM